MTSDVLFRSGVLHAQEQGVGRESLQGRPAREGPTDRARARENTTGMDSFTETSVSLYL